MLLCRFIRIEHFAHFRFFLNLKDSIMSAITALASTLTSAINNVQSQISDVQTQLASGKKNLNPADLGIVTRLSAQVTGYQAVGQNVTQAQSVINVGQTALGSISTLLTQAKQIATQASNAGLTAADRTALNTTFQAMLTQIGGLIDGATVNGANLLSGDSTTPSASNPLNVTTGIDGGASAITSVSNSLLGTAGANVSTISGTGGVLTNTAAAAAVASLTVDLAQISVAQSGLSAASVGLSAQATGAASLAINLQSTVDSIQNIDQTALQAQLQQLNNQQTVDYYLVSQMNTEASAMLSIFR
jgi:flagellin-like hook-associated protein FlgL